MSGVRVFSATLVDLVAINYLERFMGEQKIESASKARTLIKDSFLWYMVFYIALLVQLDECQCTTLQLSRILHVVFLKLGLDIYLAKLVASVV